MLSPLFLGFTGAAPGGAPQPGLFQLGVPAVGRQGCDDHAQDHPGGPPSGGGMPEAWRGLERDQLHRARRWGLFKIKTNTKLRTIGHFSGCFAR
jgi:hypothetical protein